MNFNPPSASLAPAFPDWTIERLHGENQLIAVVKCRGLEMCRISLASPAADSPRADVLIVGRVRRWIREYLARA